ncbi:MAG: hypothetical protein FWD47_14935 [Treponema sp.]|nr:hypothetical protein [Treponema sp.]
MGKTVRVTKETDTGRNTSFQDIKTGNNMNLSQFIQKIENGKYQDDYHIRVINGVKTPCSNPDKSENNNLG